MRYGGSAARGGLVIDVADVHPLEFPKAAQSPRAEGYLLVFAGTMREAQVLCFYWTNQLGACRASTPVTKPYKLLHHAIQKVTIL
ncbi:unnamed protein product [Prunus armeniaca]